MNAALDATLVLATGARLLAVTAPPDRLRRAPTTNSRVVSVSSAHRVSTVYTVEVNGRTVPVNGYGYTQFSVTGPPLSR